MRPAEVRIGKTGSSLHSTYVDVDISGIDVDAMHSLLECNMPDSVSGYVIADQAKFCIWELRPHEGRRSIDVCWLGEGSESGLLLLDHNVVCVRSANSQLVGVEVYGPLLKTSG